MSDRNEWKPIGGRLAPSSGEPPADPNEQRAKLRQQWREGRETFYLEPHESLDQTVARIAKQGPEVTAGEIRDLMNSFVACRNAMSHLQARLRYAIGERDGLEDHLGLALEEAKMQTGQRALAESALKRTCDERDALRKQVRALGKKPVTGAHRG